MEIINLEREGEQPKDWESNVILRRNANGTVEEVIVPDDTEEA